MGVYRNLLGTLESTFKIGKANISAAALTAARAFGLPDRAGTLALDGEVVHNTGAESGLAGDKSWDGAHTFNNVVQVYKLTGNAVAGVYAAAGTAGFSLDSTGQSAFSWFNGGSLRWQYVRNTADTEMQFIAYGDDGVTATTSWKVTRSTGLVTFTVSPIVGTLSPGDNSTKAASTAYADNVAKPRPYGAQWESKTAIDVTLATDVDVYVPNACTITGVYLVTQGGTGSCVVDIKSAAFPTTPSASICASAKPTISGGTTYSDATLTGWTTTIPAGSRLRFSLQTNSVFKKVSLFLKVA